MCEAAERIEHVVHDAGEDHEIERHLARFAKGGAEVRQLDPVDEIECRLVGAADRRKLRAGIGRPVIGDDPARTPPAKHGRDQAFHRADVQAPPPLQLSPAEGGAGKPCAREILSLREHARTELHAIVPAGQGADLLVGESRQVVRNRRPIHERGARALLLCELRALRSGVAAKKGLSPLRRLEDHLPFVRFEFGVEEHHPRARSSAWPREADLSRQGQVSFERECVESVDGELRLIDRAGSRLDEKSSRSSGARPPRCAPRRGRPRPRAGPPRRRAGGRGRA
jgi:hypothetical protein